VHGDIKLKQTTYSQLLRKQLTLVGNWNSDFNVLTNDWIDSINVIANGGFNPESIITHRVNLKEGEKAFDVLKNREFFIKIMVVNDDE
jgi:L-iditol 2-dehydrogenase